MANTIKATTKLAKSTYATIAAVISGIISMVFAVIGVIVSDKPIEAIGTIAEATGLEFVFRVIGLVFAGISALYLVLVAVWTKRGQ